MCASSAKLSSPVNTDNDSAYKAVHRHTDVVGLLLGHFSQAGVETFTAITEKKTSAILAGH